MYILMVLISINKYSKLRYTALKLMVIYHNYFCSSPIIKCYNTQFGKYCIEDIFERFQMFEMKNMKFTG